MLLDFVDLGRKILGKNEVEKDSHLLSIAVGFCRIISKNLIEKNCHHVDNFFRQYFYLCFDILFTSWGEIVCEISNEVFVVKYLQNFIEKYKILSKFVAF